MSKVPPPQRFTTADGSIQGTLDGINTTFTTGVVLRRAQVYRNGKLMTLGTDCVSSGSFVIFLGAQIPESGDIIEIEGWT